MHQGLGIAILAGGRSRRMGRDKAFLELGGENLPTRLVRRLARPGRPVVVATGRAGRELPDLPLEVRSVSDEVEGQGPMAGLLACMQALEPDCDRVFVSACDQPFLNTAFVDALDRHRIEGGILVPIHEDRPQVLTAIWSLSLLPRLRELFESGERRLRALLDLVPTRRIEGEALRRLSPDLLCFHNLNRPEEYEQACRLVEAGREPQDPVLDPDLEPDPPSEPC